MNKDSVKGVSSEPVSTRRECSTGFNLVFGDIYPDSNLILCMYQWECTYCDHIVRETTVDDVKQEGKKHLKRYHRNSLADLFQKKWTGKSCQSGCGTYFYADQRLTGFKCPKCGHDHFSYFAGQHVWVGVEEVDK